MTKEELMAELEKLPAGTVICLRIANPKDSAGTDDVQRVQEDGTIVGWVAADNERAWIPGYGED